MSAPQRPASLRSDPMQIARLLQSEHSDGRSLPPVHRWDPPFCGDIDMEIRRNGEWFYLGTPIKRAPLVRLFSTVLRRDEDGAYYLVTPVEKVRIRVEDAPFLITTVEQLTRDGVNYLVFRTQTGEVVIADHEHPIWLESRAGGEPAPYVHVRDRLHALIGRNAYYQLIEWGTPRDSDDSIELVVHSASEEFVIGRY